MASWHPNPSEPRMALPEPLLWMVIAGLVVIILVGNARADGGPPIGRQPIVVEQRFQGRSAEWWAHRATFWKKRATQLQKRWHPTVDYSFRLASAVTGVSYWQLRSVAWCESRHYPYATNGRYKGLFQLGWSPFGMSPFDPVANALSAALTVRRDGSWRQWSCKPG